MADVKWIKIVTNIFDNRKVVQIEHMPDGYGIVVIWFKLLCLAGEINDDGAIYLTNEIPYTEQLLATEFRMPLTLIQLALSTFVRFGMIEIIDDVIHVSNWEKYQNVDAMERMRIQHNERQARYRERKRLEYRDTTSDATVTSRVTASDAIEEDKEEDKEYIVPNGTLVQTDADLNAGDEFEVDEELDDLLKDVKKTKPSMPRQQMTRFEKFWEMYPKKQGRQNAERVWKRLNPSEEETNKILIGLANAKQHDSRFREQRFTPMPSTWLNAGSWEDEFVDDAPSKYGSGERSYDVDDFLDAAVRRTKK